MKRDCGHPDNVANVFSLLTIMPASNRGVSSTRESKERENDSFIVSQVIYTALPVFPEKPLWHLYWLSPTVETGTVTGEPKGQ